MQHLLTSGSQRRWGGCVRGGDSERLWRGHKGWGLRRAQERIPGPARSQGEGPEGGLRGTWTPEQSGPWEATGRDEGMQHFLVSGSQISWEGGVRGGDPDRLGRGCKGRGVWWARERITGPAWSQGESTEGGLRGTWSPEQNWPLEAIGWDEHVQHLLISGCQRH